MDDETIRAAVDGAAGLLDLPIPETCRPGVLQYFRLAASMAEVVLAVPLARDDEPGSSWRPVAPGSDAVRRR